MEHQDASQREAEIRKHVEGLQIEADRLRREISELKASLVAEIDAIGNLEEKLADQQGYTLLELDKKIERERKDRKALREGINALEVGQKKERELEEKFRNAEGKLKKIKNQLSTFDFIERHFDESIKKRLRTYPMDGSTNDKKAWFMECENLLLQAGYKK